MIKNMNKHANGHARMADTSSTTTSSLSTEEQKTKWEMTPGGMLVQKRSQTPENYAPNLRLKIAYGGLRYEIYIKPQATFGELKKLLTVETGLQPEEQMLIFRGKERENREFLDACGVKNKSKVVLVQDPLSIEKRYIEVRRNAKIQRAHRAISKVSMEIDKLADQVSSIEKSITNETKVPEVQIITLIEMLMRQAIKLDGISCEGDASSQKNLQSKRVQKCVETLDMLKIKNAEVNNKPSAVTTKCEIFDPPPPPPPAATEQWEIFD